MLFCTLSLNLEASKGPAFEIMDLEIVGDTLVVSCDSNSIDCTGFIDLTVDLIDDCGGAELIFSIDLDNDGTVDSTGEGPIASANYPVGNHTITWSAVDTCEGTAELIQNFHIDDCTAPVSECFLGLITVIPEFPFDEITIWASDFSLDYSDNCGDVTVSFSPNSEEFYRTFRCEEFGFHTLELWAADSYGNQEFCDISIVIQYNYTCGESFYSAEGDVLSTLGEGVENVEMTLENSSLDYSDTTWTDSLGFYYFNDINPLLGGYSVSALKNYDVLNGVSAIDIVLIQKHLLGIKEFDSGYDYIAADINNSQSVSALDMVELQRTLLGIKTEFFHNTSWRFINVNASPIDTINPWPFSEECKFNGPNYPFVTCDFAGVKVGDLNGTANPNSLIKAEDRTPDIFLPFGISDLHVNKDELFIFEVKAKDFHNINTMQLTWNFESLEFLSIESGALEIGDDFIGSQRISEGLLSMIWYELNEKSVDDGETLFTMHFRASQSTNAMLSELISLTDDITSIEAYRNENTRMGIAIDWDGAKADDKPIWNLEQNSPNPLAQETNIAFTLAIPSQVNLVITDINGIAIKRIQNTYEPGIHQVKIERSDLNASGVYIYEMTATPLDGTEGYRSVKKMIVVD